MTPEEFREKEIALLEKLPFELRSTVSYMAYERGHSAGYHEVLNYLLDMVGELEKPIKELEKRIRSEYQTSMRKGV